MNDSKQLELSLKTLLATIFLGVSGDLLLRDLVWGLGAAIYGILILAVGAYLYRHRVHEFGKGVLWVVPPTLMFVSMFAWRDSLDLKMLNGLCVALLVAVLALRVRSGRVAVASLVDYPCRLVGRWVGFVTDILPVLDLEGGWSKVCQSNVKAKFAAVLRGFLIAAPLLLVFGVLFASSDAVFSNYISNAFSLDAGTVFSHAFVAVLCLWVTGGFLRRLFLDPCQAVASQPPKPGPKLGITEITIVLTTLNSLFLAFVLVQMKYLFGGHALVQQTAHLSYAEYAHQGFFELVLVAFLGLGVLVGAHNAVQREQTRNWRTFVVLAFGLVMLIGVVMASAATRMEVYVDAYGITRERLYVMAGLIWLALTFGWFCATTLQKRSDRFAPGALAGLFLVVIGLNCINPDGTIVRLNSSRTVARVDGDYLSSLSDDAVPQLISVMPRLQGEARGKVSTSLAARRRDLIKEDWRSWSLSDDVARRMLAKHNR